MKEEQIIFGVAVGYLQARHLEADFLFFLFAITNTITTTIVIFSRRKEYQVCLYGRVAVVLV
jgi:hypothetical protein